MDCELGSSLEKVLTLTNDGPVPVLYKFAWADDSIEIASYAPQQLHPVTFITVHCKTRIN